ncbi:recombinase family protein [Thalassolituus oleivorans]|uniref:Resolvase n=1 Tax=Thalassolituus oleivorans MIL-1 TaxID=1298593 RepID=M5DNP9_9GAMM|nr:recombinase family protein [Thalassolituus oleivorans]CCU70787.1 resolvase [Thalassolituus oleivorans MIL-1]
MADFAYIRVSSTDQSTERQLADVSIAFERVFTDKVSGSTVKRPQLEALRSHVREGDTIHVHSIDRLARNLRDLRMLVDEWRGKGVTVRFHKENLTFNAGKASTPMDDLLLSMLGAVSEFERSMIRERQAEGIRKAKEAGKYNGGSAKRLEDDVRQAVLADLGAGLSFRKTATKHDISVSSVQRISKESIA